MKFEAVIFVMSNYSVSQTLFLLIFLLKMFLSWFHLKNKLCYQDTVVNNSYTFIVIVLLNNKCFKEIFSAVAKLFVKHLIKAIQDKNRFFILSSVCSKEKNIKRKKDLIIIYTKVDVHSLLNSVLSYQTRARG